MNYKLPMNDQIAKDLYNMASFDVDWAGPERSMDRLIKYFKDQSHARALTVCIDAYKDEKGSKAYDRGYVKGVYECMQFIVDGIKKGRVLQFPPRKDDGPKIV